MTHLVNGAAGNIESHSTPASNQPILNITAVLDYEHYGFTKLKVINSTALSLSYILGQDGSVGDEVTVLKKGSSTSTSSSSSSSSAATYSATPVTYTTTEVVTSSAYTTYCPTPTVITQCSSTYTVTEVST